jgi:sugar/nucleoside kinase (ribokinase family)
MSIVVVGSVAYDTVETARGKRDDALGGAATFFSVAARFFAPVSMVGVIGTDFKPEHERMLTERGIDVRGLEHHEGKTFHWHGRYHEDMNKRDTISLALNVFDGFNPTLLPDQKLVAADTMDFWIENARPHLTRLLERLDILTVNDDEARMLSGEHNLVKAGHAILKMGPKSVLVKRGEYGVLQFSKEGMFAVPAYPLEDVIDPTGAGDTFAGGLMGFLARQGRLTESILRTAVVYGTVMASYTVENFSMDRLLELTWEEIDHRYRAFIELTDSHSNRWNSPS